MPSVKEFFRIWRRNRGLLPGELVKQCWFVLMTNINKLSQREHFKQYSLGNKMLFSNNARYIQMSCLEAYSD